MRARFIGRSSMGFETGKIYNIKTDCKIVAKNRGKFGFSDPFPCLCVYDIYILMHGVLIVGWKHS